MSLSPKNSDTSTDRIDIDVEIDTCGTRCPLPLLRAKQALKEMMPGELLQVLATDPAAKTDFEAMLRHLPHRLVVHQRQEGLSGKYPRVDVFVIEKGAV